MLIKYRTELTGHVPLLKSPNIKGIHEYISSSYSNILIASALYSPKYKGFK